MSEWQTFYLKDLGKIVGGATPPTNNPKNYGNKIAWITPKDLSTLQGRYIKKGSRSISRLGFKSCSCVLLPKHAILFSSRAPIGYVAIAEKRLCTNQDFKSIIPNKKIYFEFLYYLLKYHKNNLINMGEGTTIKGIYNIALGLFQVKIPPTYYEQQKIARTLSVLDQKIENNHKINELLHKILELLYEQYFVRFDFSDENNKPYQTSGGKMKFSKELNRLIPNDFEVKTLGDNPLCNTIKTGVTPFKQKVYYETKHIQETLSLNQGLKVSYNKRPNRANMQPSIYSVWFAKMKDTKKHLFLNQHMQSWIKESILSTGFCGLQCQKHTFEYIASTIKHSPFETRKNNLATGATQKAINIEALDYIFILIPNKKLLDNYSKITKPLYEKISNNIIETQTLTALRDFLLPLLLKQQVKPQ
ncbi:type I restriction modification DNA specificity domain protein [Helicobacter pylori Hp P-11b]|uniref:Type I restriction modification DNA specificity domain protein n=1 Tax=Helicobacter pylori Hp P-11b TaxID=992106 RepID=J0S3D2_HELPX|nr:restriction endonuclease subunit S [Helicobacter pylori]EJC09775.1 type-1 restriction enzyme MjaXIP specificity protein [Helicobacter pylori Hp P-11]EJC29991.1 type I restriction modification DNA specificity domain protein [Helicobacter pylori Hp P-11b]